jgi:hypothetical protein
VAEIWVVKVEVVGWLHLADVFVQEVEHVARVAEVVLVCQSVSLINVASGLNEFFKFAAFG